MTNQTCPTCGNQVEVTTSSEGTGCFKPIAGLKARIVKCLESCLATGLIEDLDEETKEIESILTELGGE